VKGLIFTYVLCYGGSVVALVRPWYGVLVYICFAIIKPESLWHWAVPKGNYSRIVALALLAGWALNGLGSFRVGAAKLPLTGLFVAWFSAVFLSFGAYDQSLAWGYVEGIFKILLPIVVAMTLVWSIEQIRQLAWTIVLSQGYVAFDLNMSYLSGYNRLQDVGFGSMDNNTVAITMVTCFGLAFFLGLYSPKRWQQALAFAAALLIAHAVMISFSRGALLTLIITGAVSFLLIPKGPKHYAAFLVAFLIGVRLAGPQLLERFSTAFLDESERDRSANLRVEHWHACLDSMARNPLGVGPAQWRFTAPSYGLPSMEAHSFWLQTGAELGVAGLLGYVVFYAGTMILLWPLARRRVRGVDPWLIYSAQMVLSSLVGFCFSAQFVTVNGVEAPFYVTLVGLSALKLLTLPSATVAAAQLSAGDLPMAMRSA
jgi:O-antigen ligase